MNAQPRDKVQFRTNVPVEVALAFDEGKLVEGAYGDVMMYGLEGNRVMFVPPIVSDKLKQLGVRRGEPIRITKAEVKKGNRRSIEYQVERVEESNPKPASPTPVKAAGEAAHQVPGRYPGNSQSNTNGNGLGKPNGHPALPRKVNYGDAIERCLLAAIRAARRAEQHAAAENNPVRFTSQDIQGLASTIFIQASREGWIEFSNGGAA